MCVFCDVNRVCSENAFGHGECPVSGLPARYVETRSKGKPFQFYVYYRYGVLSIYVGSESGDGE